MKTKDALIELIILRDRYRSRAENSEAEKKAERNYSRFRTAFLRRIEQGDAAREALRIFADDDSWKFSNGLYEWDRGVLVGGPTATPEWETTNPIEIAQKALELQP